MITSFYFLTIDSSHAVGEDFQNYKAVFTYLLKTRIPDSPSDKRFNLPYLLVTFTNSANRNYRIRQHLFNLSHSQLTPYLPPSTINFKD